MCFQRSSKRIEGESRPPKPGWKVVPQSRTGSREIPVAKLVRLRAKFRLDRFILSPSGGKKTQFLPFFKLRHFVMSPLGNSLRKLNTGAQLLTFPHPKASQIVSVLQRIHGEIGRTIYGFQQRDEQTDKQTKNSTFLAAAAAIEILATPNLAW